MSKGGAPAWIRLLLARGYRLEHLIVDARTGAVRYSADDLTAAAALVQNPDKLDLTRQESVQELRELIVSGRLPRHLVASSIGNFYYDTDQVSSDCEAVAFGWFDEKCI